MFGWEFPPHNSGGLGVASAKLASALASSGVEVVFVLPRRLPVSEMPFTILFADETPITLREARAFSSGYVSSEWYRTHRAFARSSNYGATLFEEVTRYAIRAASIAQNEQCDVLHAHDWLSFGAGVNAKRVSQKPLASHVHATEFDRTGGSHINEEVYLREKAGMDGADRVIAVSALTKRKINEHYMVPEDKIDVVYNSVDENNGISATTDGLRNFKSATGKRMVLFVGRFTLQKGPDYFLRAAKLVLSHDKNVFFVMAGSGDMEHQIVRMAAELGIGENVFFAGFVRGEELSALYRAADVFVMPSVSEPFGITTLESLSHGTPVIISKQSGVSEVLRHALKVDFWDVEEMANKIISVLHNRSLKTSLEEYGRREAIKYTWRDAAAKVVEIYRRLLDRSLASI
ncbi:MAG: glycosyltransferase family 4 protein [Candidatus Jacksonbacteria bacterium]|nr:glycosyltransferase family 4 protein [Candidatus Jacksonbacteria bacterium]